MTPPDPDLTPLSVLVAVLTVVMGRELAIVMGAYSIILLGWFAGCIVGLFRLPKGTRIRLTGFVLVTLIITLGITVPGAQALASYVPLIEAKGLLFPVAVAVPAIGHSWLDVAGWLWLLLRRRAAAPDTDREVDR